VRVTFGIPGSGASWQLITALEGAGVPFVIASHEAAGAIMAGAYARQSGSLGCAISIKGPGLANMVPGLLCNAYEQWPTLSIAEAFGPGVPRSMAHKRLDHRALTAPLVKAYATLGEPGAVVGELASIARAEIPGPTHLDLFAEDAGTLCRYADAGPVAGDAAAWERAQRAIERARRPVVIAGSLATRQPWAGALAALRIPIFTTVAAKGVVDERSRWAAGVFTGAGRALAPESAVLARADLVVGLGLRTLEVLGARPFACASILLDVVRPELATGFEAAAAVVPAERAQFVWVLRALGERSWGDDLVAESLAAARRYLTDGEWSPGRVFAELQAGVPALGGLVVDTGSFCTVAEHVWAAERPASFLGSAVGRFMGVALPSALGAVLADATRPVACALGDGGMMYASEVKLAIDRRLPVLFLLITDGRYGSVAGAPSAAGLSARAITLPRPSWCRAMDALGCAASRVSSLPDLMAAAQAWKWRDGPLFLELPFEPERYAAMTTEIRC
jgi:acetolactate synthase-1/2/3 large subunit